MKAFLGGCQAVFVYKDTSRRSFFSILRNFLQCPGTRVWFEVLGCNCQHCSGFVTRIFFRIFRWLAELSFVFRAHFSVFFAVPTLAIVSNALCRCDR